jgi:hypothetical protein
MIRDDAAWRHEIKVGDLVMMKHGGMAVITKLEPPIEGIPPYIRLIYCDDGSPGNCSSHRVEKVLSETVAS